MPCSTISALKTKTRNAVPGLQKHCETIINHEMNMQIEITEAELEQITKAVKFYPQGVAAQEALILCTMELMHHFPQKAMEEAKNLINENEQKNTATYAPLLAKLSGVAQQLSEFAVKS
jgi:hypothetical protein